MEETSREAVATAVQRVAGMLQRSDQLDKVEQYRRREARKKASVEARLKAAIQSQLDGVRTGLTQLHTALLDVKDIQSSLANVSKDWRQSINTIENLKDVKDAVVQHSQLAAAVENLKNIFSVPEIVLETQQLVEQGELLHAHRKLMELECSRDDLMYEQYRMDSKNTSDMNLISIYFEEVQGLSDELAKQLWMVLQRSMVTVRRDPTMLVSVVRIIEREEKLDRRMVDRKKQTGFIPPGRPKRWKDKMFEMLEGTVSTRIEGTQAVTRETDKMWLVRLLEITRKYVLDDLIVVKNLMVQCFPPHYNTFNRFFSLYHNAVSTRVKELTLEDLEANEIVSLLTWVLNTYKSVEMMGHPDLCSEFDINQLEPLLLQEVVDNLLSKYVKTFTSNITGWLRKALETDKKDWLKETEPEADQDGYYQTTLPAIVFQNHLNDLLTRKWLTGSHAVDTICVTVEDYFNDFNKVKKPFNQEMTNEALRRVVVEYLKAVMQKRITFKNADERKDGAERMIKEAEQFKFLFKKLAAGENTDRLCGSITAIAEVIKLTDPTLLFLEVTTLVSKYPDIREDHIQALLAVRGDASREMRQMIIGTLSENKVSYSGTTQPIFKDITVPTITMTTMTTMTSMATAKLLK
ncbi:exocyst complex component 3 isoform X3 [Girardinichthys multiradiatus]|uniref:exocyst complex component 3 isoform X3 n=1 Tax=Girardinichthys multiradiatus TaxID=208333 RepID=UPI001FAE071D|nr:exocyst complex component 3 isoform X3 [Girardinichthys multiradiatus]